jgi:hypothetical protein
VGSSHRSFSYAKGHSSYPAWHEYTTMSPCRYLREQGGGGWRRWEVRQRDTSSRGVNVVHLVLHR